MRVRLKKKLIEEEIGNKIKPFLDPNDDDRSLKWRESVDIDLSELSADKIDALIKLLSSCKSRLGKTAHNDVLTWKQALEDRGGTQKPRTVEQFSDLLKLYLDKIPGHRVFEKVDGAWLCYYVNEISYHPETRHGSYPSPAYCSVHLIYVEFGGRKEKTLSFYAEDCTRMTLLDALSRRNFVTETKELRQQYLDEKKRFDEIVSQIGKQYLCTGTAVDDLDGNRTSRDNSWYWSRTNTVQMEREGDPTRVVVDVFYEDPKTNREDREARVNTHFWLKGDEEPFNPEVPIHPKAAVFDMSKHLRVRTHVNNLTEYVYDETIADKLVLSDELKSLIHVLIEHKRSTFRDVVQGKDGGAVVLLGGPPGTGKTLTAEVFAESEKRALYSIQCSQLGTDPDELEDELLKVFARSRRWKAVTILDEADVYVRERGSDLAQNAIVGVFLRVLEYQSSILFLTTNRPNDVDDAIASRCIARLNYKIPSRDDQKKIWKILAQKTGADLNDKAIDQIVTHNPDLSGRDVKNLLKLALLLRPGKSVTPETIEYVKHYRPTRT